MAATKAGTTPDYWDDACRHLSKRDRVMRKLIPQFGEGRLQSRGDAFTTLARSIVGQQISVKAAQSVWERFAALLPEASHRLKPASVLALATADARGAGLSARKVEYLFDLAQHFESGSVHVRQWQQMLRIGSALNYELASRPARTVRNSVRLASAFAASCALPWACALAARFAKAAWALSVRSTGLLASSSARASSLRVVSSISTIASSAVGLPTCSRSSARASRRFSIA